MLKTVFFGTPEIAVPALVALAETTDVRAVVCQPDRPAGRKLQPKPPAVKVTAQELGIPVHQPVKVKTGDLDSWLKQHDVDLAIVLAYGRILPGQVLAAPRLGAVNLHASILPKYRGAAPIHWVLKNGETETGVSLMQMDEGLDTGPVFTVRKLAIQPHWDAGELTQRMAELCAQMVREDLALVVRGVTPTPQDERQASYAPPITNRDAELDWKMSATELHNTVRALNPAPGAFTYHRERRFKLLATRVVPEVQADAPPGTVIECKGKQLQVATGSGVLAIDRGQLEGKKPLAASELINGRALALGDVLGPRPG